MVLPSRARVSSSSRPARLPSPRDIADHCADAARALPAGPHPASGLYILDRFETLDDETGALKDAAAIRMIMRIADGNYIKPVKDKARALLDKLRKSSGK